MGLYLFRENIFVKCLDAVHIYLNRGTTGEKTDQPVHYRCENTMRFCQISRKCLFSLTQTDSWEFTLSKALRAERATAADGEVFTYLRFLHFSSNQRN